MLRAELVKAKEYVAKLAGPEDKRPARDLRMEALGKVLTKELPLLITAQRAVDIMDALSDREGVRHQNRARRRGRSPTSCSTRSRPRRCR